MEQSSLEIASLRLQPYGEDRSTMRHHLLGLFFWGMAPKRINLSWIVELLDVRKATLNIQSRDTSMSMYASTTYGCSYAETRFLETLRNLTCSCTPIRKPWLMPLRTKCVNCESRWFVSSLSNAGNLKGDTTSEFKIRFKICVATMA